MSSTQKPSTSLLREMKNHQAYASTNVRKNLDTTRMSARSAAAYHASRDASNVIPARGAAMKCQAMSYPKYLQERDECIAAHAFYLWLLRGCPEGSPEKDWIKAEEDFDQEFLSQIDLGMVC